MIKGKNLVLRAPEIVDLPTIYRWENDPCVRVVSQYRYPVSAFAIEQYIINSDEDPLVSGQIRLMAVRIADNAILGHLDIFDVDTLNRRAGVGILVDSEFRGKGYAAEILDTATEYSITTLELNQLWCHVALPNEPSIKLFEKAGFIQTGTFKQWLRTDMKWQDVAFLQKIFN